MTSRWERWPLHLPLAAAQIKEYLDTGKVQELEDIRAGKAGGTSGADRSGTGGEKGTVAAPAAAAAGPKSAAAAVAFKFM